MRLKKVEPRFQFLEMGPEKEALESIKSLFFPFAKLFRHLCHGDLCNTQLQFLLLLLIFFEKVAKDRTTTGTNPLKFDALTPFSSECHFFGSFHFRFHILYFFLEILGKYLKVYRLLRWRKEPNFMRCDR